MTRGRNRKPVPVVSAILVNARGEVLLQLRDSRPALFPDHWTLPGGYVEPGETPDAAIRRELWEEMELALPLTHWTVYEAPRAGDVVEQHVYLGELDAPAGSLPLHEGRRLAFFGPDDLSGLPLAFGHGALLMRFFSWQQGGE